jgi:hypothetical protein
MIRSSTSLGKEPCGTPRVTELCLCSAWAAALLLLAAGCVRTTPTATRDAGSTEAVALDQVTRDAPDGAPPDHGPGVVEQGLVHDATPEADGLVPDVAATDATTADGPGAPPCAAGMNTAQSYSPAMVTCADPKGAHNQCATAALCNAAAGWTLCTTSQFLARGGKTTPTTQQGWLASCVRDNGNPTAPSDGVCGGCTSSGGAPVDVGWRCTGSSSDKKNNLYVGVATFSECRRVGVNQATAEGMWHPLETPALVGAAICCQ